MKERSTARPLSLIVAVSEDGYIGRAGELPWHLSADLKRFKRLTMGHSIIMGRKTYDSIGRPLPGRNSIVITRQPDWNAPGISAVSSLEQALRAADADDEPFIIGGGEVYRLSLPAVNRIYQTLVHTKVAGDVHFPDLDETAWHTLRESFHERDERNEHSHTFRVLERVPGHIPTTVSS